MPIVRSRSPSKSSNKEDSSRTATTDWSMETPVESSTVTSGTTGTAASAGTSRTLESSAPRSINPSTVVTRSGRSTRTAVAASTGQRRHDVQAPLIPTPRALTAPPRNDHTTEPESRAQLSSATVIAPIKSSTMAQNPKKTGGKKEVPPFVSSETLVPHAPRSNKSSKRLELEARRELLKKQMEVAQMAAALAQTELELVQCDSEDEIEEEFEAEKSTHVEQWVERTTTYIEEQKQPEPPQKNDIKELADAIITASRSTPWTNSFVPQKTWDLPDFNGTQEEWLPFKRAYHDSATTFNEVQNMARLRKAIKGNAKEAVRSLLFAASDPCEVIDALERRFGRPEQLVLAEVEKIKELPRLSDTPKEICIFASRISNTVNTIQALNKPQYLYSPEISRRIVEKMTAILKYRWYDYNARTPEEPELLKIKKFLDMEADLCGAFAVVETIKRRPTTSRQPVHATYEEEEHVVATTTEAQRRHCLNCNGDHWITECKRFREASVEERWQLAKKKELCFKCLRQRHTRMNCRGQACKRCKRPHHVMLHAEREEKKEQAEPSAVTEDVVTKPVFTVTSGSRAYLKMVPVDIFGPKGSVRILALLDEGSTVTLLDANVATRIGATGKAETLILETVGGKVVEKKDSQRMDLRIKGAHRQDRRQLRNVRTVESLLLSPQCIRRDIIEKCKHLKGKVKELLYDRERPSLLIGQDNWDLIVSRKIVKGKQSEPVASLTSLGWVLHGRSDEGVASVHTVNYCLPADNSLEDMVRKHFELESIGIQQRRPSNDVDERAQTLLSQTTAQRIDGRYETGLLWKTDNETLPYNYAQALNRLTGVEKKLDRNKEQGREYARQLQHLVDHGYAEEAPTSCTPGRTFYIPHFAVVHPAKGKMRIVFDAAAKFQGKSLNDALLPGPDLLQPLFGVLLRFRQGPIAVAADIKEMFLQIKIRKEDRDCLRYLWRGEDREAKPREYRMTSVIFGAASSPATAIFVKNLNAEKHKEKYPEATEAIVRNHYMDDYLQSFWDPEEARKVTNQVQQIHRSAGFELHQWASNRPEILQDVAEAKDSPDETTLVSQEERTLGLRWSTTEDALAFDVRLRNTPAEIISGSRTPTKREVTSAVMSTFDPLGLIAPVLIQGKKLIQNIWRAGTDWDDEVKPEHGEEWHDYVKKVESLSELRVARCLAPQHRVGELHVFVDASETAYAAACYWRSETSTGEIKVALIAGKARVTPVKKTSIPRLELQAALLGGRLAATITCETDLDIKRKVFWSDSSTVLQWIKSDPRRFKAFVAHRLAELEELSRPEDWRWVPTKKNPADDATRETKDFGSESRWFVGPEFLRRPEEEWPKNRFEVTATDEETRERVTATIEEDAQGTPDPHRFSSWLRLLRSTARVFMFLDLCRKRRIEGVKDTKNWLPIDAEYLERAKLALLRASQRETFSDDINRIEKKAPLGSGSRLKRLDIAIDDKGVLRLNSRIRKMGDSDLQTRPVILEGKSTIARLLIRRYHEKSHHGNHATVMSEMRQRYWIISLRNSVKKVVHLCQWCKIRRAKPQGLPLEEVVKPYVGPDGRTRIADVRTKGEILRRPTSRLVVIVPAPATTSFAEVGAPEGAGTRGETVADIIEAPADAE